MPASVRPLLIAALLTCSCLEPTQVVFDITTDVPCDQLNGTSITVGLEGETEKAEPVKVVTDCSDTGTVSAIGTYTVTPKASRTATASFKVVAAVSSGVNLTRDCIATKGYRGCIVARRRIAFVPHRNLRVPVSLVSKCLNIQCDQNTSCNGNGTCSTSEVDTSQCTAQGTCSSLATRVDTGLPCFNDVGDKLFCGGETNWCTRDTTGIKACGTAPADQGVSYQCRTARDCGPNLKCVSLGNSIQGMCMVDVTPGLVLLCTGDDVKASCGSGFVCPPSTDGGQQSCAVAPDAGTGGFDAGPPITWAQQAFIKASNPDVSDNFGDPVALSASGDTLVVGAWTESSCASGINGDQTNNGCYFAGAAYVFQRDAGQWAQEAYLKASNPQNRGRFGFAVAITPDGQFLAVGAFKESSASVGVDGPSRPPTKNDSGAVYLFRRSGGAWAQISYIKASNPDSIDYFGSDLALSRDGKTLAVTAPGEDSSARGVNGTETSNAASGAGAVYVFRETGGVWAQEAYLKASNTEVDDTFGSAGSSGRHAVALSDTGDVLAVGAPGEDSAALGINGNQNDNSAMNSGAVYVFRRSGTTWAQEAYVKASNAEAGDGFSSVTLSGDGETLVVGAVNEDSAATGVDGSQVDNTATANGAAYVYQHTADGWAQTHYLKPAFNVPGAGFGGSVTLSRDGQTLSIGAIGDGASGTGSNSDPTQQGIAGSGAAFIFTRVGDTWAQRTFQKASNPGPNEYFGVSTWFSDDAHTWVVGAHYEATDAGGINPTAPKGRPESGAVYVFTR